jgi:hypothetical protein
LGKDISLGFDDDDDDEDDDQIVEMHVHDDRVPSYVLIPDKMANDENVNSR